MKGYSVDLRQRVLAAVARGMPRQQGAQTFGVRAGTIKRLLTKQQQAADLAPHAPPARRATISPDQEGALHVQREAHPDAPRTHHAALWNAAHGTTLRQWPLGRAIRRRGWTRKTRR